MKDTIKAELEYPRLEGRPKFIEIGLMDVRAADSIRVSYDFGRDGWVIEQASKFAWGAREDVDPDWKEVAFVQAWERAETEEQQWARIVASEKAIIK